MPGIYFCLNVITLGQERLVARTQFVNCLVQLLPEALSADLGAWYGFVVNKIVENFGDLAARQPEPVLSCVYASTLSSVEISEARIMH